MQMNLVELRATIEALLDAATDRPFRGIPFTVEGKPGIGKSALMQQTATARGWDGLTWQDRKAMGAPVPQFGYIDARISTMETVDTRGIPMVDPITRRTIWALPDFLPYPERDGEEGILNLEEWLNAPMPVQVALLQLTLDGALGDYRFPANWRICGTGNRLADKSGVQKISIALASRFAWLEAVCDPAVAAAHAESRGLAEIAAWFRFRPNLIHVMPGERPTNESIPALPVDAKAFPNPRAYFDCHSLINLPATIRQRAMASRIGDAFAGEFEAFLCLSQGFVPIQTLIADPEGSPVPDKSGMKFAVAAGLARYATVANFAAVARYVARLGREFETMAITAASGRDANLKDTPAFVAWALANAKVLA